MKRILACILVAVILLSVLAACDSNDDKQTSSTTNQNSSNNQSNISQNTPGSEENKNPANEENKESENEEIEKPLWTIESLPESSVGLKFELNEDGKGYTVTGIGTCTEPDIIIGKYNNLPVTIIGNRAFQDCTGLTSVTIGNSITSIEEKAFYNCYKQLTSITIPNSTTSIGKEAFRACSKLTNITIPDNITSIGYRAFYNTAYYNDESNWDKNVLYIGNHLIKAKDTISGAYTIKEKTKTIADSAFSDCTGLTHITIPNGVTSVGCWAFSFCQGLTSMAIPNSVTSIGYQAFSYCKKLTTISIPNSVRSIGSFAFVWCTGLTTIDFKGTKGEWKDIEKDEAWDGSTGDYVVKCTDGDIAKADDN